MQDKLAIVGSHPGTRDLVPWDDQNFDIWTINESATFAGTWVKRTSGILQIHPRSVWDNPKNQNDANHGAWLKANTTIPVYMIEKFADVPMAEAYPLQEIAEKYLENFEVMQGRKRREFFTTTVAYMAALAAYKGYKQVDFFGVELSVESEYRNQRGGAMFWVGILTQYAKVRFFGMMFEASLYGVEQDAIVDLGVLKERLKKYEPELAKYKKLTEDANRAFTSAYNNFRSTGYEPEKVAETMKELSALLKGYGAVSGAMQELSRRLDKAKTQIEVGDDYWFSHHEFERDALAINQKRSVALLEHGHASGMCDTIFNYAVMNRMTNNRRKHYMADLDVILPNFTRLSETIGVLEGAAAEDTFLAKIVKDQMIGAI